MTEVKRENEKGKQVHEATLDLCPPALDIGSKLKLMTVSGRTSGPVRRSTKGGWTDEEDDMLTKAVRQFNGKNWKKIAELFPGRTDLQCRSRWKRVLNPELIKGTWTKEEDDLIIQLVEKHGCKWSVIAKSLPGRIGKQCQDRWLNYLNPAINKDAWTREEEEVLVCAHQIYGSKWAEIAKYLPGRTGIFIKSHLKSSVKKRLDSFSESGFIEQPLGAVALDLNSDIQSVECPKGEPLKRYADDFISHDWKLNAGSFNTSNVGLGHQNISPKEQFLDVQSTFTGDSKCLRAGNIHTLPEDSKHLHKVVEPITEDSKCTTPGETNYEPLKSLQQNLSKSGDLALRDVNKNLKVPVSQVYKHVNQVTVTELLISP
ncbi:transcription factor MYB3R-5-like [Phoenix dactylifera]|uniref:Transcription factor MYB3R-5-like n=1 Tax=Phoenix dactylifera TaxID=42345 RepID=A0A8B7CX77_PHODC|nr:transcription factor MYB3R-5-like [Phoenix dactylifera]